MIVFLIVAPIGIVLGVFVVAWLESDAAEDQQTLSPRARGALRQSAGSPRERGTTT
jgi:hypothetical protein